MDLSVPVNQPGTESDSDCAAYTLLVRDVIMLYNSLQPDHMLLISLLYLLCPILGQSYENSRFGFP